MKCHFNHCTILTQNDNNNNNNNNNKSDSGADGSEADGVVPAGGRQRQAFSPSSFSKPAVPAGAAGAAASTTTTVTTRASGGVVILSEFSAVSRVLNGALRVNPWKISEVVAAIDRAATMGAGEKRSRMTQDLR